MITKRGLSDIKFGTKSGYPFRNLQNSPIQNIINQSTEIHTVFRHGTRNPTPSNMKMFEKHYPDYPYKWKLKDEKSLVEAGKLEHRRFGRILKKFASPQAVFISSSHQRSIDSAKAFYQGADADFWDITSINDAQMRYYDNCPKHVRDLENKDSEGETKKREYVDLIGEKNFAKYLICGYELAIFDESEMCDKVQDFSEYSDIKTFYRSGFGGNEQAYLPSSVVVESVLDSIEKEVSSFRFGHAETVLPMLALLDLVDVEKGQKYWDSSTIGPFAANIWFLIDRTNDKAWISVNEKVVRKFATIISFKEFLTNATVKTGVEISRF